MSRMSDYWREQQDQQGSGRPSICKAIAAHALKAAELVEVEA